MNPTTLARRAAREAARISERRATVTLLLQPQTSGGSNTPSFEQPTPPAPSEHTVTAYATPMDPQEINAEPRGSFEQGGFLISVPVGTTDQSGNVYAEPFPSPVNGRELFIAHPNDQVRLTYAEGEEKLIARVVGDEPQAINAGHYSLITEVSDRSPA